MKNWVMGDRIGNGSHGGWYVINHEGDIIHINQCQLDYAGCCGQNLRDLHLVLSSESPYPIDILEAAHDNPAFCLLELARRKG